MRSVSGLTIDSFLPRGRMKSVGKSAHVSYVNGKPFPHMMISGTTDFTYLGHRIPLDCPEDDSRRSLALYDTSGRPTEEVAGGISRIFGARGSEDLRTTLRSVLACLRSSAAHHASTQLSA
jgi:hypothetical protein